MIRRRDLPALLAPALAACGSRTESPVRIAAATNLLETYLIQLAQELGYFREAGLNAVIESLYGSRQMESLVAGSTDIGYQTYSVVLQFAADGQALRSFLVTANALSAMLVVAANQASRIQRVEDLKGATIGVANFGSVQHQNLETILSRHGVAPADAKIVTYGSGTSAAASLQYGKVDAGMINCSAFTVLKRRAPGIRVLFDPRTRQATKELTGVDGYPNFCLLAKSAWLERNAPAARKLTMAMLRTIRWVHTHTAEEVRDHLPAALRTEDREADLESLRVLIEGTSTDGRMPAEAPEGVRRYLAVTNEKVRHAKIDLAATYTNQFVEEASR